MYAEYHIRATSNKCTVNRTVKLRGSYMSAHVLLNLLNKLGRIDKM